MLTVKEAAMVELDWFECYPPAPLKLPDVVAVVRLLADRGRPTLFRRAPVVTLETWIEHRTVRWLIGMDRQLSRSLPSQFTAQLPGLALTERRTPDRPPLRLAQTVRPSNLGFPLRLDTAEAVTAALLAIRNELSPRERVVVQWVVGPSAARHRPPTQFHWEEALGLRPPAKPDAAIKRGWRDKVDEPLFGVQGRIGVVAHHTSRAVGLLKVVATALGLANSPHTRLLIGRGTTTTAHRLIEVMGSGRTWSGILNAAELAALLGWPLGNVTIPGRLSALLGQAPKSLRIPHGAPPANGDRVLGVSLHPADSGDLVTMPAASTTHHLHIIGPTGSGKSHELAQLVLADADAGHAVMVIEPKGDLINDVLARLTVHRHKDVVLIEPGDASSVVGFNPLAGPAAEAERRADELLHLFRELFGSALGPRSSDVLLHALITAARLDDGTLTDVPVLLTNPAFRRRALSKVSDPLVLAPYWAWFDGLSDGERSQVISPIQNKLRVFVSRASIRRMLGQPSPRFDLSELLTSRRIVLVNLNRGVIGPETAALLGSLLLQQLWQAIQRRAAVPSGRRRPVMVIVDEWQDYVSALNFGDVLAQSRGLGVGWTLAHQHLHQLSGELQSAVLANARSRLAFRPAQKDVRALAAVLGGSITDETLEQLGAFEVCARLLVRSQVSDPFGLRTLPLAPPTNDVTALRQSAQQRFGVSGNDIDQALRTRWQGGSDEPEQPIGITRRRSS
jgi:hypothetical protein